MILYNLKIVFCYKNLSDVDVDNLFSELKALQICLTNMLMSGIEILQLV
jgi:hypothetical protein